MVIVADTGPLLYLFLIGQIDLLPALYSSIATPAAVAAELSHRRTPPALTQWFATHPSWLHVHAVTVLDAQWPELDSGEQEALALAIQLHADLILTDDAGARQAVRAMRDLRTVGTIGILYQAALERSFPTASNMALAFDDAISELRQTNFFFSTSLDDAIGALSVRLHTNELK